MMVFLNGQFVSEERAVISVLDRGFLYGDGVFETLRVCQGSMFRWKQHAARLKEGAGFLAIPVPFSGEELEAFAEELIAQNALEEGLLRLTVSRGTGARGYSPKGAAHPTVTMTVHPSTPGTTHPEKIHLVTSTFRLPAGDALAQFKTCNKLAQILARAQADQAGAHEALLTNTDGFLVEGSSSNLFWVARDRICTPPLPSGILPGVTRAAVLELCGRLGVKSEESNITTAELKKAQGAFITSSAVGVAEAQNIDGELLNTSALIKRIEEAYEKLLRAETEKPRR